MSSLIRVLPSTESIRLEPGQRSDLTLTVQNLSEVVDRYRIVVEGIDPSWVTISRLEVALFPKDQDQVRLTFHPPVGPTGQAGRYDVGIRVVSQDTPESTAVQLTLEVSARAGLELSLHPRMQSGPGEGLFTLQADNRGNVDLTVQFEASDPLDGCSYQVQPSPLILPAAQERKVELRVKPKAPLADKSPQTYPFVVTARPADHPELVRQVEGTWEQVPRARFPWAIAAAVLGGLVLIAAAVLLVWKPFSAGPTPTAIAETPTGLPTAAVPTPAPATAVVVVPSDTAPPTTTPVPTEESAPTDTPQPTAAPTAPPTSTPTVTPLPTVTPTPTEACVAIDPALEPILAPAEMAGLDMECATGAAFSIPGAFQEYWANVTNPNPDTHFRSLLIWRSDNRDILVLDGEDTDASQAAILAYTDTWEEGDPEVPPACAAMTPPAGYELPIRGFGRVWCSNALWDPVGWPAEHEEVATLTIQPTQYGLLMRVGLADRGYLIALHYPMVRAVTLMTGP